MELSRGLGFRKELHNSTRSKRAQALDQKVLPALNNKAHALQTRASLRLNKQNSTRCKRALAL